MADQTFMTTDMECRQKRLNSVLNAVTKLDLTTALPIAHDVSGYPHPVGTFPQPSSRYPAPGTSCTLIYMWTTRKRTTQYTSTRVYWLWESQILQSQNFLPGTRPWAHTTGSSKGTSKRSGKSIVNLGLSPPASQSRLALRFLLSTSAMLAIGGPYCEYSLGYIGNHKSLAKARATFAVYLTDTLPKELQAMLSRDPAEKGWRMMEKEERVAYHGRKG